ncbi:hypothetical protein BH11PSE11_BH11PSE11_14470 [soil metagenome]
MSRLARLLFVLMLAAIARPGFADSASLLAMAQANNPVRYQFAVGKNAEIRNTSDNKSFTVWWQPSATTVPTGVIVALHGHDAFATDEFYLWQPYAAKNGYALLTIQWWFGAGEATSDYYEPKNMYPLIAAILKSKGVKSGSVLMQGYSRGSANSYAMTAQDATSPDHFFGMTLSVSGGAASNYPPNQEVVAGAFGSKPYTGIQWVMYCGEKDPDPTTSGCIGMSASRDWVTKYGANVALFIDDPNGDHGGFMKSSANVDAALAAYSAMLADKAAATVSAIEFYHAQLNHYFRTPDAAEASGIDKGSAGAGWTRTGDDFPVYLTTATPPGGASVCRFYGSVSPGPNSHFYTASQAECDGLKASALSTPAAQKRWNYEGLSFAVGLPSGAVCPSGTTPVYRLYNNGYAKGVDSNHRYTTLAAEYQRLLGAGWTGEGVAMCSAAR